MLLLSFVAVFSVGILSTVEADSGIDTPDVNLALGRPATQSSDWSTTADGSSLVASLAVDGAYKNHIMSGPPFHCAHTADTAGGPNWWRVQLDQPYLVDRVTVTNRKDDKAERLDYFIVGVTNSAEDPVRGTYPLCGQYPSTAPAGATLTVACDPNIGAGQYVIIQQPANGAGYLTLCEVEVYARKDPVSTEVNLALGRPATQSSEWDTTFDGSSLDAGRAVDGNYKNDIISYKLPFSCAHTADTAGGPNWWRVQLDRPYHVEKVSVTSREDCCAERLDNFIVGVTNSTDDPVRGTYPVCAQFRLKAILNEILTVECDPRIDAGQYVIIQQPADGPGYLTLCEVEVYGRAA